jgi:glycosyltransferase involved in cell wall biosynthesis
MTTPAVSVLMAVWKPDRRYLELAIRSILGQTFGDFELLIVEDPSGTPIADLVDSLGDHRIRLLTRPVAGPLGGALNFGLAAARAELVARMDGDDIAVRDRLERQVAFLRRHPEVAVHGSRITVIDAAGVPIGRRLLPLRHDDIVAALRRYNCISHPSVMFRKSLVLGHGGYDATTVAEDYELWCRLAVAGVRFENDEDDLVHYRFHERAAKFRAVHREIRTTIAIKRRHFAGRLTIGDRLRIAAESALLRVPPAIVIPLFRLLEYRRSSRRAA